MIIENPEVVSLMPQIVNLVDKFIDLSERKKKFSHTWKKYIVPLKKIFEEYLDRAYKKYNVINTMVSTGDRCRALKDLYVPLTLENIGEGSTESYKINGFNQNLIQKYRKILIEDTAGMGKSTLTKRMFLDVIDNEYLIPIYIELRKLSKEKTIIDEIQSQINPLSEDFDNKLLLELIQMGNFVFFLDGYDEISLNERTVVTDDLKEFISKANNNIFILTSRPEKTLSCFGDFYVVEIQRLQKEEAYTLLRNYDNQGDVAELLIKKLQNDQTVNEFLENPLLVSLLLYAFDFKHKIPSKKHIFYQQVYEAYFETHDMSKGDYIHEKYSKLRLDEFERVLRFIGYRGIQCHQNEYDKQQLLDVIEEAKDFCSDLNFQSSDFFHDLIVTVPLFCQDGQSYRWVHKSLQEYFSALFIYKDAKKNQDAILKTMYKSKDLDKYINLLDLYYDIDIFGFNKNILLSICKDYINYYDNIKVDIPNIDLNLINIRKSELYLRQVYIKKTNTINIRMFDVRDAVNFEYKYGLGFFVGCSIIAIINYFNVKKCLLDSIIQKHRSDLYIQLKNIENKKDDGLLLNKIYEINIKDGDSSNTQYDIINKYLYQGQPNRGYLNINACRNEKNKIEEEILKKESSKGLLEGL